MNKRNIEKGNAPRRGDATGINRDVPPAGIHSGKTGRIDIRVTAEQLSLLEIQMAREGWDNISGYVRARLFGQGPEAILERVVSSASINDYAILFMNLAEELKDEYNRIADKYEEISEYFFRTGQDMDEWGEMTIDKIEELTRRTSRVTGILEKFAENLQLMPDDDSDQNIQKNIHG